jgi:hypothetical protein
MRKKKKPTFVNITMRVTVNSIPINRDPFSRKYQLQGAPESGRADQRVIFKSR